MRIAIGSDHRGYHLKEQIIGMLRSKGHEVLDEGTCGTESVDYPDFAKKVADSVASGKTELGILVCGTGIGMSITANKVHGVRAAVCRTEFEAKMARAHNDANILCLGQRVTGPGLAKEIVRAFLQARFTAEERHLRRVNKVRKIENQE